MLCKTPSSCPSPQGEKGRLNQPLPWEEGRSLLPLPAISACGYGESYSGKLAKASLRGEGWGEGVLQNTNRTGKS
jgi:hypothetical protein